MRRKILVTTSIIVTIALVLFPSNSVLATNFDNFDSYTNGDLAGQGNWLNGAAPQVQGTVTQNSSAKAISRGAGGSTPITDNTLGTSITTDGSTFSFYTRTTNANDGGGGSFGVNFYDGTTLLFSLKQSQDNNDIRIIGATTQSVLGTLASDTWYQAEIEFNFTSNTARARVNNGTWSSSVSAVGSVDISQITRIAIEYGGTTGTSYLDTFEYVLAAGASASTVSDLVIFE